MRWKSKSLSDGSKIKKKVALLVDELSDDEGRYVLDIMAVLLDFDELSAKGNCIAYLIDTNSFKRDQQQNRITAIVRTVKDCGIDFDNVRISSLTLIIFLSTLKKEFNDTLFCLFPLSTHIACNSHIVSLVATDFKKAFM